MWSDVPTFLVKKCHYPLIPISNFNEIKKCTSVCLFSFWWCEYSSLGCYQWAVVCVHWLLSSQSRHGALPLLSAGPAALQVPPGLLHQPAHPLVLPLPLPGRLQRSVCHRSVSRYFSLTRVLIFFCRNKMIAESSETNQDEDFLENWTKWRLFLSVGPANTVTVYPNSRLSLANLVNE